MNSFLEMSANPTNLGLIIVPDEINLDIEPSREHFAAKFRTTDETEKRQLDEQISSIMNSQNARLDHRLSAETKLEIYDRSIGLSAMMTFIGLYLGTVFLIASAALLGLKEISESSDNQSKYLLLRQLGVDQKILNRTLLIQITIFFGLPLLVAIIHSIFGIMFANQIIRTLGNIDLLIPIITTALFVLSIYGTYYLITYLTSKRIILDHS
jgi:putative ABC transport system permease protein